MTARRGLLIVAAAAVVLLLVATALPPVALATPPGGGAAPPRSASSPSSRSLAPAAHSSRRSGTALQASPEASTTPTWTELSPAAGAPPPRISGGLVYDGEDGYTILFGGEYLNETTFHYTYYNDTWEFSGGKWTNITPVHSPSPRFGFGIAFDPLDGEVVLFGGRNAAGFALNDTWEFSGGTWSNLTLSHAPSPRFWPSMAYDSATDNVVLFGGLSPTSTDLNDTWTYSSDTWTQATPILHPQSRHGATLMDDPQSTNVVLFGGLGADYYNTTWAWTGVNWDNITSSLLSSINPDSRVGAGGAFDTAIDQEVMYGGYPANTYPDGTWLYSNLTWTLYNNLPNSPPSTTVWDQFTYDAADSWIVYFVPDTNETFLFNETAGGGTGGLTVVPSAAPLSGLVPLDVTLSATISGGAPPYNVTWSLGTGSPLYVANTSATYTTPGTYNLTLTVRDTASGHYLENWTVRALAPPLQAAAFSVPTEAAIGQSVSFQSTYSGGWPPYTFDWDFGDGGHATAQNTSHAYASAATFNVSFEISAAIGGSLFINFTEKVLASIPPLTVVSSLTPISGVAPLVVTAASTPSGGVTPYTYLWLWGAAGASSTTENATHTYSTPGTYTVSLNVSDATDASFTRSWSITVSAPLSVTISASPLTASVGGMVTFVSDPLGGAPPYTYAWSFGDGQSATTRNATHDFLTAGVFHVNLTVTDSARQTATASVTVTVNSPATGPSTQPSSISATDWIALLLIVIVIAMLIVFLVWRRRRQPPNPTNSGPSSPAAPPTS